MRPFIVGIAGGTASGKTTIAARAAAQLGAVVLTHDRYYLDAPSPVGHDFDRPESLETGLLARHLGALARGEGIDAPTYDFATHSRLPQTQRIEPAAILFVEGILVLAEPELRANLDYQVFVRCDDDTRLARRILRDTQERGRVWDDILRQWFITVRPAYKAYVEPSREHAALVLDGDGVLDTQVERLVLAVRQAMPTRA
ncbi:MAG: uridine kinase [Myxococcales bacterium]|nr:uridine kinase [Myxococcales bacterium]